MKHPMVYALLVFMLCMVWVGGAQAWGVVGDLDIAHFGPKEKIYSSIGQTVLGRPRAPPLHAANIPIVYPTDFGADPTGKQDSTNAFIASLKMLLTSGANRSLSNNIVDLGGAVMDLAGGDYLISSPITIPIMYGNFVIQRGTIRASAKFPSKSYIIEVGGPCSNGEGSCNENFGFEDLMLDCQQAAAGGILINATMGANIGPRIFIVGFTTAGITVNGGHEVMIHETWLGEFLYSDSRSHNPKYLTATGIQIFGNDHFVTNTIVYSSLIGLEIRGAANLITGVHTWNLDEGHGGVGIFVNAPGYTQNRLVACYLDYNDIIAVDPEHLTIVDGFFLCGGNIILRALTNGHVIQGLVIADNQFDGCDGKSIMLDQSNASFSGVFDTTIDGNMYTGGYQVYSTKATAQVTTVSNKFTIDFSDRLLFPTIQTVTYSLQVNAVPITFVQHASSPPEGLTVTVYTSAVVNATVTISVDQSAPSHPCC